MKPCAFLAAAGAALAGCASLQPSSAYVGRPIADAVRELGPPESIADYEAGGRFFSWSTSDVIIADYGVDNPANWLEPMNRASAPEKLDEEKLVSLPDYIVSPPFRPRPCTFTLAAEWDAAAKAWVARRAIRKGAGQGGRCGLRTPAE